jgi:LysM repeat protein
MPHYNDVYINQQDFEICLHHGMRYDGFVEGLGYAYTSNFCIPPRHFQKYNPPGRVHDDESFFQNGFVQYIDTSPKMRLMSVKFVHKVKAGDTLTSISIRYDVSIQSIKDANSGVGWEANRKSDRILAGEELKLPKEGDGNITDNPENKGVISGNPFLGPTVARANFEQRLCDELYGNEEANNIASISGAVAYSGNLIGNSKGSFRITKNGTLSPKYYSSGWTGGSRARIVTYGMPKVGSRLSFGGSVVSTWMSYYALYMGDDAFVNYSDAAIGTVGLSASFASYYSGAQYPVIGFFVAIYGSARLGWDVGASFAPKYGLINGYYWDRNKHLRPRKSIL